MLFSDIIKLPFTSLNPSFSSDFVRVFVTKPVAPTTMGTTSNF